MEATETPEPPETEPLPEPPAPGRTAKPPALLPACILTGLVALGVGYGIGRTSSGHVTATDREPPATVAPPAPVAEIVEKAPGEAPVPPTPAIAAPEAALRSFLAARDGTERLRHCLFPDLIAPRIEEREKEHPETPIQALSIRIEHSETDRSTGRMLLVFQVATPAMPGGIPVAVMETADGWKVDWESFTEFHGDRFKTFAEGPGGGTEDFHLIARNTHYLGEPFEGIERYTAYRLDPPMPDRGRYAFVPTGSEIQKQMALSTENGVPFTPVLRLVKSKSPDGRTFLEITGITATDWRPRSP